MDCKKFNNYLDGYINNKVSPDLNTEIERHIADCSSCRIQYENYKKVMSVLSASEKIKAPVDFKEKILAMTKNEDALKKVAEQKRFRPVLTEYAPTTAYVAAAILIVLFSPDVYSAVSVYAKNTLDTCGITIKVYQTLFYSLKEICFVIAKSLIS